MFELLGKMVSAFRPPAATVLGHEFKTAVLFFTDKMPLSPLHRLLFEEL